MTGRITTKRLIAFFLLLSACINIQADDNAVKKQINSIKKDSQYLYGEYTASTEQEAKKLAEEALQDNIAAWAKKQAGQSARVIVGKGSQYQKSLKASRGNMVRIFFYVKKSDLTGTASPSNTPKATWPDVVMTIASYKDYQPMAEKIRQLKEQGKILQYGRYASLDNPEHYYLAIYNKAGKVEAVLTPGVTRYNVATGETDRVTNYSGCGAIGFTIKQ